MVSELVLSDLATNAHEPELRQDVISEAVAIALGRSSSDPAAPPRESVLDLAMRDRDSLLERAALLRRQLAAIEPELEAIDAFVARFRAYADRAGVPAPQPATRRDTEPIDLHPHLREVERGTERESDSKAAEPPALPLVEDSPIDAWLVLEAATGQRRIPIPTTPLRIGSGDDCDLVFPVEQGVAPEHALVWMAGDEVLFRAPDREAAVEIDGSPMTWASLEDGDVMRLGDVNLSIAITPRPCKRADAPSE